MFSKKMLVVVGAILLIGANGLILYIAANRYPSHGLGRIALLLVAPFQDAVSVAVRFSRDTWDNYFDLVSTARENSRLKQHLKQAVARNSQWREVELSNIRLRQLLDFKTAIISQSVAAEVVGRDPSSWYQAVIINKGSANGIRKGLPVVVPEGIAGQVTDVAGHYAKVMLIIDRNSAVDALVQRTRARGIIEGEPSGSCRFKYVMRKEEVAVGDKIVASGLDGVFPKGMAIGDVTGVVKRTSDIFQEVTVSPHVDFEKLEEVLVVLTPPAPDFVE
jgi:rod shape-determining protein MreC